MIRILGAVLAWLWGALMLFTGVMGSGTVPGNEVNAPLLIWIGAGAAYCYAGYGLVAKRRVPIVIGILVSGWLTLVHLGIGLGLSLEFNPGGRMVGLLANGAICLFSLLSVPSAE